MSWRMPGAEDSASSMTTASFGNVSPIACSSANGCTGVACASARAFAASASRSAAIAFVAAANRSRPAPRAPLVIRSRTAAMISGSVPFGSPRMATAGG